MFFLKDFAKKMLAMLIPPYMIPDLFILLYTSNLFMPDIATLKNIIAALPELTLKRHTILFAILLSFSKLVLPSLHSTGMELK